LRRQRAVQHGAAFRLTLGDREEFSAQRIVEQADGCCSNRVAASPRATVR
jgi:hypothetical protein